MMSEEASEIIRAEFATPDLITYWPELLRRYKEMGFTDELTDAERIAEFTYIIEQVRKYVFTKDAPILKYEDNLEKMLEFVDDLINKSKEKASERKVLVYHAIRDEWLLHLRSTIEMAMMINEEIDDGW